MQKKELVSEFTQQAGDCNQADFMSQLSRLGWKWAVLASTVNRIYKNGNSIPNDLVLKIRTSKSVIESGCYSICDVNTELMEIEKEIFSYLLDVDQKETMLFQDLVGKAMSGTIKEGEIDLVRTNVFLADCLSLPCVCS